jgi:lipopolysaccharide export system permease protein
MMTNTLGRYFAGRFVISAVGVFASIFVLLVLVDYIEMVRKTSGLASASAITVAQTSLFRVPQLLEKMMPFCVLIGAMTCYLALSRRLELVVARAAGVSAWQFVAPPGQRDPARHHRHHRLQSDLGESARTLQADGGRTVRSGLGRASRMRAGSTGNGEGQSIINAAAANSKASG